LSRVSVRYIVDDVDAAIGFYRDQLGFEVDMHPAPTFAMLSRGDLCLLLSAPSAQGGGGQTLADGSTPEPGGWNRFQLVVSDLAASVERLRQAGVAFRSELVSGVGGDQVLLQDPSGNLVELFEPKPRS
jgi:catechol 2,3-dioxygenase-like lactoylglutathione lyase family enzyme